MRAGFPEQIITERRIGEKFPDRRLFRDDPQPLRARPAAAEFAVVRKAAAGARGGVLLQFQLPLAVDHVDDAAGIEGEVMEKFMVVDHPVAGLGPGLHDQGEFPGAGSLDVRHGERERGIEDRRGRQHGPESDERPAQPGEPQGEPAARQRDGGQHKGVGPQRQRLHGIADDQARLEHRHQHGRAEQPADEGKSSAPDPPPRALRPFRRLREPSADEHGQRREHRQDVGRQLGVGLAEKKENESGPDHQEPGVGVFLARRPAAAQRLAQGAPEETRPGEKSEQPDGDKIPPRTGPAGRRRGEPLPMLIDEIAVHPGRVVQCNQHMPRRGQRQEQQGSCWQIERPQPVPLVAHQQPEEHDRPGDQKADQAFGERGQRHASVERVKEPPPACPCRFLHAQDKAEKRRAHQHRHRHVEQENAGQGEIKQGGGQNQAGRQARVAPL